MIVSMNDWRAISAISNPTVAAGNSDRPGSDCRKPSGSILRTPKAVVKEIVGGNAEKMDLESQ